MTTRRKDEEDEEEVEVAEYLGWMLQAGSFEDLARNLISRRQAEGRRMWIRCCGH